MRNLCCLLCLCLLAGPAWAQTEPELFRRVWELVEERFYDPQLHGVDLDKVKSRYLSRVVSEPQHFVSLTNASLAHLKASHTEFFRDDQPRYYELLDVFAGGGKGEEIRALFGGELPHYTGILARIDDGKVLALVPGGPAARGGLLVGDELLAVDGADYHPIRSFEGKAGKATRVTVLRNGAQTELSLVPREVQPRRDFLQSIEDSVTIFEEPPYRIGYVRMWSCAGDVYKEKLQEMLANELRETDGLLLDLRGSWGGATPDFADLFGSRTDLVMQVRGRDDAVWKADTYGAPLLILTDATVSSGKELLSYNLQKSGRAKLIGSPTRGAVLGGALHLLPDGHALYLAEADVLVDGRRLEGLGVFPDYDFPSEFHFEKGKDRLMEQARAVMLGQLRDRAVRYPPAQAQSRSRASTRSGQCCRTNSSPGA